jgi:hypothetical protein
MTDAESRPVARSIERRYSARMISAVHPTLHLSLRSGLGLLLAGLLLRLAR